MAGKLSYSSGVIRGCYFSIEPHTGSEVAATLITPLAKKVEIKDSIEAARAWVDKQVRMYVTQLSYYFYDT